MKRLKTRVVRCQPPREQGSLSLSELERRYCTLVYWQAGTYGAASKRLGIDRRTLQVKIDHELMAKLRGAEE